MKSIVLFFVLMSAGVAHATQTINAHVNGMVCAFCAQGIEKKARALPQTADVYVNLKKKIVAVEVKEGESLSTDTIVKLVKDAGYDVSAIEVVDETAANIKTRLSKD